MPDEYHERYRRVAHDQLYRELDAGSPRQVDALADVWHRVAETLRTLAEAMRADLAELQLSWTGEASREYQYRLGLVASWTQTLAHEAELMRAGLSTMAGALAETQRQAQPEPSRFSEWAYDSELAGVLGLLVTDEQRDRAHETLARLMAELAVAYEVADGRTWATPRMPPDPDLPGRFVESDLHPYEPRDLTDGTQLAGTVDDPAERTRGLHLAGLAGAGSGGPGPAIVPGTAAPVTTLRGAGSGLASSTGQLTAQAGGATANAPSPTAAALPPPVMGAGAGFAPSSTMDQVASGRRASIDEGSWSAPEDSGWAEGTDPPPPILGPSRPG